MPTRYDSRLARDRIDMGYLASAKGDPLHPEMIKYNLSMKLFPPEKDVMMNGEWMVNFTTASIMDNDYEEVEALAVIPSMYRDEKLKAKGKRAPWPGEYIFLPDCAKVVSDGCYDPPSRLYPIIGCLALSLAHISTTLLYQRYSPFPFDTGCTTLTHLQPT